MMAKDKYANFEALRKREREGVDFRRCVRDRNVSVAVIAPHGGHIEPKTSKIAAAIAGETLNLYCFEGTKSNDNETLHITSNNFDEPLCVDLIAKSDVVVAVHGLGGKGETVHVGGLNSELRDAVRRSLEQAGFRAVVDKSGDHAGIRRDNICNRGRSKQGVQLEITKGLRDRLNGNLLIQFADAVRKAIETR